VVSEGTTAWNPPSSALLTCTALAFLERNWAPKFKKQLRSEEFRKNDVAHLPSVKFRE
jgi:hypothetical protein